MREKMEKAGCPERAIRAALEPETTKALEAVQSIDPEAGEILVIGGRRGLGKTVALAWLCGHHMDPLYIRATDLMRAGLYDERISGPWATWKTLAVDDLGVEFADASGVVGSIVDDLIDRRYGALRTTVLATNLRAAEFRARYGERVADRIRECGRYLEIDGESMRGKP
jgi:DNA replication protein DnaC